MTPQQFKALQRAINPVRSASRDLDVQLGIIQGKANELEIDLTSEDWPVIIPELARRGLIPSFTVSQWMDRVAGGTGR